MKNIGTILAAIFLALVLMLYMCTFQVRFTEVAIKKTWGKAAKDAITEPGLYFKWPSPIQTKVVYDKRVRILEDRMEETRTGDGRNILLTTFTLWRIADPSKFHTNFPGGVEDGEKKLRTTVETYKQSVVGQHEFREFVSTDPAQRRIHEIERELLAAVKRDAFDEYGIDVVDFGIKKLGLPESVTTAIFDSMRSHEEAKAARYTAEGEARANDIIANANAAKNRIMAAAQKQADEIIAEAQEVVGEYYRAFDEHPELRIFLDNLRSVAEALRSRATLIIDTEQSPWDVFKPDVRKAITQPAALLNADGDAAGLKPKNPGAAQSSE